VVQTLTFTQYYQPNAPGSVLVPALELEVNKQIFRIDPFVVQVNSGQEKQEEVPVEIQLPSQVDLAKNKPFFLVRSDVLHPFVGQAFTLMMSLYVPANNGLELSFDHNDVQIPELIQQIRPRNCWEENFGLQVERVVQVNFQGKNIRSIGFFRRLISLWIQKNSNTGRSFPTPTSREVQGKIAFLFEFHGFHDKPSTTSEACISG